MTPREIVWTIMVAVGLLGGIGYGLKALFERKVLAANAASSNAQAAAVLTSAAQELLQPLRDELTRERADHAAEVDIEREKVRQLRVELQAATEESRTLRAELGDAHQAMDELRRDLREMQREAEEYRRRIAELEARLDTDPNMPKYRPQP